MPDKFSFVKFSNRPIDDSDPDVDTFSFYHDEMATLMARLLDETIFPLPVKATRSNRIKSFLRGMPIIGNLYWRYFKWRIFRKCNKDA